MLLQGHGFGGGYDAFGQGGLLQQIATRQGVLPEYLLVSQNTEPWEGYNTDDRLIPDRGRMHETERALYRSVKAG